MDLGKIADDIVGGKLLSREEVLPLWDEETDKLAAAAHRVKRHFFGDKYDLCAVKSIKGGHCSEDCRYCSQSSHYHGNAPVFPLVDSEEVLAEAASLEDTGVEHLCLVSSGKRMSDSEVGKICSFVSMIRKLPSDPNPQLPGTLARPSCIPGFRDINKSPGGKSEISEKEQKNTKSRTYVPVNEDPAEKAYGLNICTSIGLSTYDQLVKLKKAGVKRIHNNLETSRRFFPYVCSTHTYDEKIEVIKNAVSLGLEVCSGGLFGLGETNGDRTDLALTLRELGVDSIPVNILNPIPGTPYAAQPLLDESELIKIIAIYRLILPDKEIRLCGRSVLKDKGLKAFQSGLSSAITGSLLTVSGISLSDDLAMIAECGGHVR